MRLAGLFLIVIIVMSGIGYWYYTDTQSRMAILHENNAKLETAIEISEQTVTALRETQAQLNREIQRVNNDFARIRRQNQILASKLTEHDLGLLAEEKPGLIERIIETASEKKFRCFELLSGAELTEQERNAKNGNAFNSECPWLYDGFVSSGRLQ